MQTTLKTIGLAGVQTLMLLVGFIWTLDAQTMQIDSIHARLKVETDTLNRVAQLNALADEYETVGNYVGSDSAAQLALQSAQAVHDESGIAIAKMNIGKILYLRSRYDEALERFNEAQTALQNRTELALNGHDLSVKAAVFNAIGASYWRKGDYASALNAYLNGLALAESQSDKKNQAGAYHGIGAVYRSQKCDKEAVAYWLKALAIREEIGDKKGASNTLNSLGISYKSISIDSSLVYHFRSLKLKEELHYKKGLTQSLFNIALVYEEQGKLEAAERYQMKALKIDEELGDSRGIANSYLGIAGLFLKQKQYEKAIFYGLKAVDLHEKVGAKSELLYAYSSLAEIQESAGNLADALQYWKKYASLKDETFSESLSKQTAELQTQYETERKNREIDVLKKEQEIQQIDSSRQRSIGVFGFLFLISVIGFVGYSYWQKQKSNKLLEKKNQEISEINENMTASIEYARTIQQSILPEPEKIRAVFEEHFIVYKPKSIVSGDFYWFCQLDEAVMIAVGDCTGHGVPGALMSMIGNALLNEIIVKKQVTSPAAALIELHREIRLALNQNEDERSNQDGLDVALVRLEKDVLTFAGAKRPLYIVSNAMLHEIKGDKISIGGRERRVARRFTSHERRVEKGAMLYLTTDGFADQANDKKEAFGTKRLKQTLTSLAHKSAETQKEALLSQMASHQGSENQRDDITILGIRL
jgi:serine phosphatase RsbU (regulator of sigma subunit)